MTRPFLMSGIDPLLEGLDAETLDGLHKGLVRPLPQFEVCGHALFHHVGAFPVRAGRSDQRARPGPFVAGPAKGDLLELLAVFLSPKNPDLPSVWGAACIIPAEH